MRRAPSALLGGLLLWSAAAPVLAQAPSPEPSRILVIPFDNVNREPRIYWLGEASAVLLADGLIALGERALTREERLQAFERLQVPPVASLSHATVIRIGQVVGAAQVVIGRLDLSGEVLTVQARGIRLDSGRIQAEIVEQGPLDQLFAIFTRVARRLSSAPASAAPLVGVQPPLTAFEDYIKGLLAETPATQIAYLEAALKLHPTDDRARLALWDVHTEQGTHEQALAAARAVPEGSPWRRRAQFRAALSYMQLMQSDEAFVMLKALSDAAPSAAVSNNLGVVQLRRGSTPQSGRATYFFNQAVDADPDDPGYLFNLGYAYWLERDTQAAIYWLREAVRRHPADGDAHYVLGAALQSAGTTAEAAREKELARQLSSTYAGWERRASAEPVPRGLERVKADLDAPGALRVDSVLVASERREQRELALFHLDRGRRLFEQKHDREAIAELRRALYLSPYQADAHLLLGRAYLRTGRVREAIDAFKIALWSEETVAAHVALGEAYLHAKDEAAARAEAQRALAIDPHSSDARKLLDRLGPPL